MHSSRKQMLSWWALQYFLNFPGHWFWSRIPKNGLFDPLPVERMQKNLRNKFIAAHFFIAHVIFNQRRQSHAWDHFIPVGDGAYPDDHSGYLCCGRAFRHLVLLIGLQTRCRFILIQAVCMSLVTHNLYQEEPELFEWWASFPGTEKINVFYCSLTSPIIIIYE